MLNLKKVEERALADNYGWSRSLEKRFHRNVARRAELAGVEQWLTASYPAVLTVQASGLVQVPGQYVNGAAARTAVAPEMTKEDRS
jgi:predicted DsbA family dithiol-disulfide isomerase